jgi:hypothetical protein
MDVLAAEKPDILRRLSFWPPDGVVQSVELGSVGAHAGFPWFELACGTSEAEACFETLAAHCQGLSHAMLKDLLTPDEEPEGKTYAAGAVRLASSFSVHAERPVQQSERGTAQGVGVLVFQPVELLASADWLISCWHPRRSFQGAQKVREDPPQNSDSLWQAVTERWQAGNRGVAGDLGVSVMHELALSYAPTHRRLYEWLEDWELSLYVDDELNNEEQLPELWGLMAVLRSWLNPLNKPGLRANAGKAWLPVSDHQAVIDVDERIDKALAALAKLSETMRQSFGLLHIAQAEAQQRQREQMQHRIEVAAAIFLVPTLIVGFYGANTWVPGQGKHWGFWVMVGALVMLTIGSLLLVVRLQSRSREAAQRAAAERKRMRSEMLRGD